MAVDYTIDEIREELARLGYINVPEDKLCAFKKRLMKLIESEKTKSMTQQVGKRKSVTKIHSQTSNNVTNRLDQLCPQTISPTASANQIINYIIKTDELSTAIKLDDEETWHSSDRSRSVTFSPSVEFHSRPKRASSHESRHHHHHLDIRPDENMYSHNHNMFSDHLAHLSSMPNLESRIWNWKMSREGTNDNFVNDEMMHSSHFVDDYEQEEDQTDRKTQKLKSHGKVGAARRATSSTEPQFGQNHVFRNASAIITPEKRPHISNIVRSKPMDRYQMYRQGWKLQPPISECDRREVYSKMRTKLLKKDEVKCPIKSMIPNRYVVPTTKPRNELRWAVRQCNEKYQMPPCGFFHEI